ncbi:MAG TPA: hypothetical protein VNM90_14465, partial [Haliangium sp.]|nr:hypothetical protein [Haliangium sp.]
DHRRTLLKGMIMDTILCWNEAARATNRMSHTSDAGLQLGPARGSRALALAGLAFFALPLSACVADVDVTGDIDPAATIRAEWHYLSPIELSAAPGGDDAAPTILADDPDPVGVSCLPPARLSENSAPMSPGSGRVHEFRDLGPWHGPCFCTLAKAREALSNPATERTHHHAPSPSRSAPDVPGRALPGRR